MRTRTPLDRIVGGICAFALGITIYHVYCSGKHQFRSGRAVLDLYILSEHELAGQLKLNAPVEPPLEKSIAVNKDAQQFRGLESENKVAVKEESNDTNILDNLKYEWFHPSSRHSHAQWEEREDWTSLRSSLPRIVVSFTTTPNRIKFLYRVLHAIKAQDLQPDAIYINVPKVSRRTGQEYVVPDWIVKHPNITVNIARIDYGPATKLLPTLEIETDPETIIIVIDDDVSFATTLFSRLAEWSIRLPSAVIGGGTGLNVTCIIHEEKDFHKYSVTRETCQHNTYAGFFTFIRSYNEWACMPGEQMLVEYGRVHCVAGVMDLPLAVDIVEAHEGLAVKRGFFDDSIYDFTKLPDGSHLRDCFFRVDDIWWAQHFSRKSIPRFVVPDIPLEHLGMERIFKGRVKLPFADISDWPTEEVPNMDAIDSLHNQDSSGSLSSVQCNELAIKYINGTSGWGDFPREEEYVKDTPQQYDDYLKKFLTEKNYKEWKIRMSLTREDYEIRRHQMGWI
ncbi:hypothetical protein SARC_05727 [Sphaeroforma arctica JP610]|uniref:Uncharacterized protein n=1 Tax=Sphaeroforma arctica JP610 TaxID=667725 RepID=A0A0L0G194_9EUKA|nr:hypothetical protein SARC_05727 [Sphaeroforma arctica JP610]KNC81978.1 hypothetical protein SARC_05727 [Sphaeroforma arctica JP610]|eukprot:XP_014155880.1 hypothetical protein SARC_05727 [Sphaeroforma arctica JP610]